jgi:hypothetical protein
MAGENKMASVIRIICYGLPYDLSNQIYNEFESRFKDAKYLINTYAYYEPIRDSIKTVELLLALSIFHKRVITNLDSAIKFYGSVTRKSSAKVIRIGSYFLDADEKRKIQSIIYNFRLLIRKYSLPERFFEYLETKDFIGKIVKLKKENAF